MIPQLAESFLAAVCSQEGELTRLSPEARRRLRQYRWPGNVRELRNAIQRAYVMAPDDTIGEDWLPAPDGPTAPPQPPATSDPGRISIPVGTSMADAERDLILATLKHFNHHKERTAAVLGISLKTLYNRLKDYAGDGDPDVAP